MTEQEAIRRATELAQQSTTALDAAALADIELAYEQAAQDIQRIIQAHAGADGDVPLSRLQDLLKRLNARLQDLSEERNALLDEAIAQSASLGVWPMTKAAIGAVLAAGILRVPIRNGKVVMNPVPGAPENIGISASAAWQASQEAAQFVRDYVAGDGLKLSDRLWRLDRGAREMLTAEIESAIIQGHGAAEATRAFLARGEPVPADIAQQMGLPSGWRLGNQALEILTGKGRAMDNAMRIFRTEINRAHIEAYRKSIQNHPDAVGTKFKLSPLHPQHDICDLHAEANLYGLGKGVYPFGKSPLPAHPNTISYEVVVFADEVSEADKQGQETQEQALSRLTPEQQIGVLGKKEYINRIERRTS